MEKTKNLTLAEALASGRPFKHKNWKEGDWVFLGTKEAFCSRSIEANSFEWQILPEEQPLMRVWYDVTAHSSPITVCEIQPSNQHMEMSKALATALAPHLKDLLK